MVSSRTVTSCLALLTPAQGFVRTVLTKVHSAEFGAALRAPVSRQPARQRGVLLMRQRSNINLSDSDLKEGPKKVLMNIKTGDVLKEEQRDSPKTPEEPQKEMAKSGPGLMKPDMELFCKAAADDVSLGDCPFAHYVQMVLHYKKLPFKLSPRCPTNKPDWLVEEYDGKMPCLVDSGEAYTESSEIAEYVEYFYPEPPLSLNDNTELLEKAREATSGVFGALAKCVKNLDTSEDGPLVKTVMSELQKVDDFLKDTGGPFLCGEQMTLADCSFAPKLYHASTCLAQFKNTVIPPEMEHLHKYMDTIFAHDAFIKSSYPPDVLVYGWNKARGTEAK